LCPRRTGRPGGEGARAPFRRRPRPAEDNSEVCW
jgi:hypothetical protein